MDRSIPTRPAEPLNSIRGPSDGRYKFAFIEFGDQGSALDTSQRAAAINVIRQAQRPLLFVYIHGWMNNANSVTFADLNTLLIWSRVFPR